jgi:DNA-binding IclR family transcriptional regulator
MEFCLKRPAERFSLLELAKHTQIAQSTCHSILMSMVQTRYLRRHADKTYSIGPSLVSLSIIARQHYSPLQIARDELRALADELDVVAILVEREGTELVVRERAASVSHLGFAAPSSPRYPLFPRGGFVLLSLSVEARALAISEYHPALSPEEREDLAAQLAFLTKHGFAFGTYAQDMLETPRGLSRAWLSSTRIVRELDPARDYATSFIIAPVYDEYGDIVFGIALAGFEKTMAGAEIEALGKRLISACQTLSYMTTGTRDQNREASSF